MEYYVVTYSNIYCKYVCYITTKKLSSIIEQTWETLLIRSIYEPNFITICAAIWEKKSKMCLLKIVN